MKNRKNILKLFIIHTFLMVVSFSFAIEENKKTNPPVKKESPLKDKKPENMDAKKPEKVNAKKPENVDAKKPEKVDAKKPENANDKKPENTDAKKPEKGYTKKLVFVNRKVLILNFFNQQKIEKLEYLSTSIADSIIDPLIQTKFFEIMNRDKGTKAMKELKISLEKAQNEAEAIKIGKKAKADAVILGNYLYVGNKLQISAKVIDVLKDKIQVYKSVLSPADSAIFASIEKLAKEISQEMKDKFPPMKAQPVKQIEEKITIKVKDKIKKIRLTKSLYKSNKSIHPQKSKWSIHSTHTGMLSVFPLAFIGKHLNTGLGMNFDMVFTPFFAKLTNRSNSGGSFFLKGNIFYAKGIHIQNMTFYTLTGGLAYIYEIIPGIVIMPFFNIGASFGQINYGDTKPFNVPALEMGGVFDYFFTNRLSLSFTGEYYYTFSTGNSSHFITFSLGAGYKF